MRDRASGFPAWIPHPTCWLKALTLAIPTYLGGIFFAFFFWISFIFEVLITIGLGKVEPLLASICAALMIGAIAWYATLKLLYLIILKLLWANPPRWLRPSKNRSDFFSSIGISTLATLPIALVFIVHILAKWHCFKGADSSELLRGASCFAHGFTSSRFKVEYEQGTFITNLIFQLFWVWFAIAAILYQVKRLIGQRKIQSLEQGHRSLS